MQLRYAAWDGAIWQTQAVAQGDWDYAFDYAVLVLDGDGRPRIAYTKNDPAWGDTLHYAQWDGAAWQVQTLHSKEFNATSAAAALVLDSAGRPHIVHAWGLGRYRAHVRTGTARLGNLRRWTRRR